MTEHSEKHFCYKHPNRETRIACTECGKYICTKCLIPAPVGQKCPDCVASKTTHLEKISIDQFIIAGVIGLTTSSILSYFWHYTGGIIALFLAYFYGVIVCKSIQKSIGIKIGFRIQTISASSVFLGMFYNPINLFLEFASSNYSLNILLYDLQEPITKLTGIINGNMGSSFFVLSLLIGTWASVRHFKL